MSNVTALKPTARELLKGIKIIDVDTHISESPPFSTDRAPAKLKDRMPRIVGEGADRKWVIDEDKFIAIPWAVCAIKHGGEKIHQMEEVIAIEFPDADLACYDPATRVKMMDDQGIHAQIA